MIVDKTQTGWERVRLVDGTMVLDGKPRAIENVPSDDARVVRADGMPYWVPKYLVTDEPEGSEDMVLVKDGEPKTEILTTEVRVVQKKRLQRPEEIRLSHMDWMALLYLLGALDNIDVFLEAQDMPKVAKAKMKARILHSTQYRINDPHVVLVKQLLNIDDEKWLSIWESVDR